MKRTSIVLLTIFIVTASITGAVLANSVTVSSEIPKGNAYIPKGTLIDAELITTLNSGNNDVNDVAYFRIKQNVIVDGVVVLPAGTVGNGWVTVAEPASFLGKKGKIELQIRNITALNGAVIPLTLDIKKYGGLADKDLPYMLFTLYKLYGLKEGGLIHLYPAYRGGEAEIPAGTKFQVAVDADADLGCTSDRLEVVMIKTR